MLHNPLVSVSNGLLEFDLRSPSIARSVDRSIPRSLDRSLPRSIARRLLGSIAQTLDRSLDRSIAWDECRLRNSTLGRRVLLPAKPPRFLADRCFDSRFISKPEIALLTPANVRAIDAAILSGRPHQDRQVQLSLDDAVE